MITSSVYWTSGNEKGEGRKHLCSLTAALFTPPVELFFPTIGWLLGTSLFLPSLKGINEKLTYIVFRKSSPVWRWNFNFLSNWSAPLLALYINWRLTQVQKPRMKQAEITFFILCPLLLFSSLSPSNSLNPISALLTGWTQEKSDQPSLYDKPTFESFP